MKKMTDNKNNYKQLKHVSDATLLEEASHFRLMMKGIIIIFSLLVIFFIWAALVEVKETTTSYGQLVPEGDIQIVQHLEGGIVQSVLVDNGDHVNPNQVLVQMATTQLTAELNQLRSREISLLLDAQRLNAFLNNETINLADWGKQVVLSKYNPVRYESQITALLEDQGRLLDSKYEKIKDQTSALQNTILQREEKLKELKKQESIWEKHMELLNQEFEMYQKLKKNNYVSYKDYLTVLRAVNQSKGDGTRINSEIEQTIQSIEESRNKLREINSQEREDALEELSNANSELLEVRHQIEKIEDALGRSSIRSSIAGTIKGINVSDGNIVKPGDDLMEIIPENENLNVESRLLPKEIGNVNIGDEVKVKVLTYDYARYGNVTGKLESISASTFLDEENKPYYKAKITLSRQYVGEKHHKNTLKAGMTVQADIITGQKTLLQYLLKPIHRSITDSFREQ